MDKQPTASGDEPAPGSVKRHGGVADVIRVILGLIALEVVMIGLAVLWVAVYSHVLDPGHTADEYGEYAREASPMIALLAGVPVFYAAGHIAARRAGDRGARLALASAIVYIALDVAMVALFAEGRAFAWLVQGIAVPSKLVAVALGGRHERAGPPPRP